MCHLFSLLLTRYKIPVVTGSLGARPRYKTHESLPNSEYYRQSPPRHVVPTVGSHRAHCVQTADNLLAPTLSFPLPDPVPPLIPSGSYEAPCDLP